VTDDSPGAGSLEEPAISYAERAGRQPSRPRGRPRGRWSGSRRRSDVQSI